ncbi:MAG TPA: AsmA family protein [Gammaproteobacteria bacterium]|jgi:AsmA protein|nr:AsmA family protein [Gammaproteobacteria bacterium]
MNRLIKILGIVVGVVVLLFVALLVGVALLVDPNDYKDDITAAVQRATGRQLTLDGKLTLEVFPTIRIAVAGATLSNAPGFGNEPMAKIGGAELAVGLLPLLSRRIEISDARLKDLELNLARDARGRNNWQDLSGGGQAAAPATPAAGGKPGLELGVGAVEVTNARVVWNDAATGSRWTLTDLGLEAQGFGPGKRFPLNVKFALSGKDVAVKVAAKTQATLTLATNAYRLDDLDVTVDGSGAAWPGGPGQAHLKFDSLAANLADESLDIAGLTLDFLGLTMAGSLKGEKLMSNLALTGAVDIREFAPRMVLERFGVKLETADAGVLKRASAKANLSYNSKEIALRDMQLALDDSKLTGRVGLEGERVAYDLAVDDINVDRYLPPSDKSKKAEEGSLDEVDLPLDVLRKLDARGELKLGKAKFSGMTLTNAAFVLTADNGALRLTPSAQLYGGKTAGDIKLQVEGNAARVTLEQSLEGVDLAKLGQDLLGAADITGTGKVKLNLVASGSNLGAMRKGLDGDVAFTITEGSIEGLDLWYELRRARARLDKAAVPDRPAGTPRTKFSSLSASGMVENAVLTNRDLNGKLDFMTLTGAGTVNLLSDAVDFDLKASFIDGPALQSDPDMVKYAGATVPLRVTGTVAAPTVLPDFGAIVKARVQQEVSKKLEEKTESLRDKLRERLGR